MAPYFITFAVVCVVLGYGLQRRPPWMWYVGWAILYLFAGYFGQWFFSALYYAEGARGFASAAGYLCGGLALWIPAAVWWAKHRGRFIRSNATLPSKPGLPSESPKA